jgi:4-hydroxybenzoate polyprenyltransferase
VRTYLSFIRFSHSVFALPFALTGALLAARHAPVSWAQVGWIILAMVAARSAAMGFNRLVDAGYDAKNPRTAMREIPRGLITPRAAAAFVAVASVVFIAAAAAISPLCLALSPLALAIVFWYSIAKRYTTYTQAFLGLAMAVAPVGGWLAAGGRGGAEPWLLGLAIGLWVGGFDVLYACQDLEFDRTTACTRSRCASVLPGRCRSREPCTSARSWRWWRSARREPRSDLRRRRRGRRRSARVRAVARARR